MVTRTSARFNRTARSSWECCVEVQAAKIADGLAALHRCFPDAACDVFIPPWNSYDDMTLDCLEEQGFCAVCAGDTVMPQRRGSLLLVPSLMAPRDLVDYIGYYSLPHLMALMGEGFLIVTLHEYEFRAPERADYMAVSELESVIRDLLAAGVTLSHLPLDMPLAHFQPRRARRLRADLLLLRQMRTGRRLAIRLGRCTQQADRALGLRHGGSGQGSDGHVPVGLGDSLALATNPDAFSQVDLSANRQITTCASLNAAVKCYHSGPPVCTCGPFRIYNYEGLSSADNELSIWMR